MLRRGLCGAMSPLVARVVETGEAIDLGLPLRASDVDGRTVELVSFDTPGTDLGREVFWHSSSHVVGQALELHLASKKPKDEERCIALLCDGPALRPPFPEEGRGSDAPSVLSQVDSRGGFFYEFSMPLRGPWRGEALSKDKDFKGVTKLAKKAMNGKQEFSRLGRVSRAEAQYVFRHNPFKLELLDEETGVIGADDEISLYRNGPFVDLCRGPHVPSTSCLDAGGLQLLTTSASHFDVAVGSSAAAVAAAVAADDLGGGLDDNDDGDGDVDGDNGDHEQHNGGGGGGSSSKRKSNEKPVKAKSDSVFLQRVYGVSFPSKGRLQHWKDMVAEAARRDHRTVGREQALWWFHQSSPGSAFMLPHGTRVFNRLQVGSDLSIYVSICLSVSLWVSFSPVLSPCPPL